MPIGFAAGHEGSAFGAALLAMDALGLVDGIERAAQLVHIEHVVEPDENAAGVYADLLPTFAALYDALAPAFHALERHR
jgi:gluconokinase